MRLLTLLSFLLYSITFFSQAGGEDCFTATTIPSVPFVGVGNTTGAIDDLFESCPDVGNQGGAPEHVYSYTTGNSVEYVDASLCEAITDYDCQLYVYENNCFSAPIGCQEDGCQSPAYSASYNSRIDALALQPNTTYYFVIDGYDAGSSGNYQFNLDVSQAFNLPDSSILPLVFINTNGQSIIDEPKITANMDIIFNGHGVYNHLTDTANEYSGEIGIELRGSSSAMFPKKGYGLETRDGSGNNNNVPLFGMPSENDWVLHAPYSDKSLLRNYLTYYLGRKMYYYAPRTQLCEVIINNEYKGVYLFLEKIKRDNGRVDIAKLDFDDLAGDSLTGGYILKIDKSTGSNNDSWTSPYPTISSNPQDIEILYHYPKPDDILPAQKSYIESYITSFEDALDGTDYLDPVLGYTNYADINSFVDYFLLSEATRNVDGYRISTYMYKDKDSKGGKLYIGPPWDYNLAFGNADYCDGELTYGWAKDFNSTCPNDSWQLPFWWDKMLTDSEFKNRLNCRWDELREGPFHTDSIHAVIDSISSLISDASARNFDRWDILSSYVWPNNYVGNNYSNEIDYLKTWIEDRMTWIDNNLPGTAFDCSFLSDDQTNHNWNGKVFPNPYSTDFYVEVHGLNNMATTINIADISGKNLFNKEFTSLQRLTFHSSDYAAVDNLPSGIYFISISNNQNTQTYKVIKN